MQVKGVEVRLVETERRSQQLDGRADLVRYDVFAGDDCIGDMDSVWVTREDSTRSKQKEFVGRYPGSKDWGPSGRRIDVLEAFVEEYLKSKAKEGDGGAEMLEGTEERAKVFKHLVAPLAGGPVTPEAAKAMIDDLIAAAMREQARVDAETYVMASSVGPLAVGTDLEALKAKAEAKERGNATEFKWDRDPYIGWTERLLLRYVSKSTGRWNKSGYFIDTVPVLDSGEARSAG